MTAGLSALHPQEANCSNKAAGAMIAQGEDNVYVRAQFGLWLQLLCGDGS